MGRKGRRRPNTADRDLYNPRPDRGRPISGKQKDSGNSEITEGRRVKICLQDIMASRFYSNMVWAGVLAVIAGLPCPDLGMAVGLSYADYQVFPHGYVDLDRTGPLAMTDYPLASIGRKMVFQTSYRSLYGLKELTDNRASLAVSRGCFTGGMAFATFGEPDYFHQTGLSGFLSYRPGRFSVGGSLIYSRLSFNDKYSYLSSITANMGAAYGQGNMAVFALTRSFNQPHYYPRSSAVMPEAEIGLSYKSHEGLNSQAKALFVRRQKPTAELSQSFRLNEYASISWVLVLLPARFGGGLHLEKGSFGFDYEISHHPVLGLTHTVMLAVFKTKKEGSVASK